MGENSEIVHSSGKTKSHGSSVDRGQPFFRGSYVQPKLSINQSNDVYEQEADAVADKVMRMTDKDVVQTKFFKPAPSAIQRKCDHCEEEEKKMQGKEMNGEKITPVHPGGADHVMRMASNDVTQTKFFKPAVSAIQRKCAHCEEEEKEKKMQRKEINSESTTAGPDTEHYVDNLNGSGQPLPNNVRSFYEPRMGYEFSNVKIHTDEAAARSAQSINALAYTSGNHIVFNNHQYSPGTDSGKRLLGHELTHVAQQSGGSKSLQSKLLQRAGTPGGSTTTTPTTTPTTVPTTTTTPTTTPTATPAASTVNIAANCVQADIVDIINQALVWLDDVYAQLLTYAGDDAFMGLLPPSADYARIGGAVRQAFNTNDINYIEVIRRRFLHVAQTLRSPGRVSINCNRQFCTVGGSSFTAAYVIGPYALTMCSVGIPGSRPIATFIHELMHAVVPQVGISNTVTQNTGVDDRAYRGDRVFGFLSIEETLDNADSYAVLAELLHARANTQIVSPAADTTAGCTNPAPVREAFARASQWSHFALSGLQTDVTLLHGAALNTLNAANLDLLNRSFPSVTNETQLIALRNAFESLESHGYSNNWDLSCATARDPNCTGADVYATGGKVTSSSVTLNRRTTAAHTIEVCPGWFSLSSDDRIKTIFAAFMIGRPSWITAGFTLANALTYAEGSRVMTNDTIPAPATRSAWEHIESDFRFQHPPTTPGHRP